MGLSRLACIEFTKYSEDEESDMNWELLLFQSQPSLAQLFFLSINSVM